MTKEYVKPREESLSDPIRNVLAMSWDKTADKPLTLPLQHATTPIGSGRYRSAEVADGFVDPRSAAPGIDSHL